MKILLSWLKNPGLVSDSNDLLLRYGAASFLIMGVLFGIYEIHKLTGFYGPFFLYGAVIVSCFLVPSWFAIISSAIVALTADYLFLPPLGKIMTTWRGIEHFLSFLLITVPLSYALKSLKNANLKQLQATQEAEKASKTKSEFLSNMSHELRTPLSGIIGTMQLLSQSSLKSNQIKLLQVIEDSSSQLLDIVNDLLDLNKVESRKIHLDIVPFDLNQLIIELVELYRPLVEKRGLRLISTIDLPYATLFYGDPVRIKQILINLLSNAIKFTSTGDICIKVGTSEPRTDKLFQIQFSIIDTGIGMNESTRVNIFRSFFQADATSSRKFGGSGLGLTIAKKLVELMGGMIEVNSKEGKGSEFNVYISLPRSNEGIAQPEISPATSQSKTYIQSSEPLNTRRNGIPILLVEDNAINQEITRIMLENAGYSVDVANNGLEALERSRKNKFAVILMDCQMPELDGYETTKRLRSIGSLTPIIALTAHALKEDQARCLDAGMNSYLSKPFLEADLIAKVDFFALADLKPSSATAGLVRPTQLDGEDVLDMNCIQRLEDIDWVSKKGLVAQLIQIYHRDAPLSVAQIKSAVRSSDYVMVRKIAHKFKSSNYNLGLQRMVHLLESLETTKLSTVETEAVVDHLEKELSQGLHALDKVNIHQRDDYSMRLGPQL
jgi:signal transduction histidine kinase/CheY-like chemotaxis protein